MPGLPPQVRVPEGLAPGQSLIVRLPDQVSARDTSSRVALCARPHHAALTATGVRGCPGLCSMLIYGGMGRRRRYASWFRPGRFLAQYSTLRSTGLAAQRRTRTPRCGARTSCPTASLSY